MKATLNPTEASPFFNPLPSGSQLVAEYPCRCDYDFYETGDPDRAAGCGGIYYRRISYTRTGLVDNERTKCQCMLDWEAQHQEEQEKGQKKRKRETLNADIVELFKQWNLLNDESMDHMRFEKYKPEDPTHFKALEVLKNFMPGRYGIILFGRQGRGKTHLALSLARKFHMMGIATLPIKSIDLLNRLRRCYSLKDDSLEIRVMNVLKQAEVLFIDDIGTEKPSGWVSEKFYEIIDYRANRLTTIFTTNLEGEEMEKKLGAALTSRIYGVGTQIEIAGRDRRVSAWAEIGREIEIK